MSAVLDRPQLTVPLSGRDHVLGTSTAAVTLVEYGDYECPFCAAAHPAVTQVLKLVPDDVLFAYRALWEVGGIFSGLGQCARCAILDLHARRGEIHFVSEGRADSISPHPHNAR